MAPPLPVIDPVLVLIGPTAIGKTALSLQIAETYQCEIISMDSVQVYRHMDIGTAKASREERQRVVHHLIDIVNPDEQYDAARFVHDALIAVEKIHACGKIPLITGGTGLYLSSLISGLFDTIEVSNEVRDPLRQRLQLEGREALYRELTMLDQVSSQRIHINDTQRLLRGLEIYYSTGIPWSEHLRRQKESMPHPRFSRILLLGLTCSRETLIDRIERRSLNMMGDEFEQEVTWLLDKGYSEDLPAMRSIGYRHMVRCLAGTWDREAATSALIRDTGQYAKRQMTWFRNQQQVQWHQIDHTKDVCAAIDLFLQQKISAD